MGTTCLRGDRISGLTLMYRVLFSVKGVIPSFVTVESPEDLGLDGRVRT